ncbi:uncharacterized protein LOC117779726 isoform X2 [Drosophila innubila]|uniref:uncharacterized protein LOC117779726 isoform X2 n=1 Tax=Drosophila innubila TaxID=198719 RepID=UPI00148C5F05|nr:uncharacterized protein LOC117779726 isoform X2 [Drosophila innubila]
MVVWREAEVNYLIDLIRCHDFVWNTSSLDYKKKHKRFKFWAFAAHKINAAFNPPMPFDRNCCKKWDNLRTYFQGEVRTVKPKNEGETSGTNTWKYSSKMSFLLDSHLPNVSENTCNSENSVFDTRASLSDSYDESEMESSEPALLLGTSLRSAHMDNTFESFPEPAHTDYKNGLAETFENPLLYNLSSAMSQQLNKEHESPSYFFGRYVGQCLDKLHADLQLQARQKINEILFNFENAQLQRQ